MRDDRQTGCDECGETSLINCYPGPGLGLMNGDNGNNERAARRSLITDQMIADISITSDPASPPVLLNQSEQMTILYL